jgi:thymidylate synthase (FAD)
MKCEHPRALALYHDLMSAISYTITELEELGIPREDSAMCLPWGMETKVVVKVNLRHLVDMAHQRLCARAYWEYRDLMKKLINALAEYSFEWELLVDELFKPKCKYLGYCPEEHSCGRVPKREEVNGPIDIYQTMKKVAENWDYLTEDQKDMISKLFAGEKQNN